MVMEAVDPNVDAVVGPIIPSIAFNSGSNKVPLDVSA